MNLKHISIIALLAAGSATAQRTSTIDVKTSTVCDMCEKTIETELIYEKGVKAVDVDLTASVVHVTYDTRKTDPDKIRTAIASIGYDADGMPANEAAWQKLPACCKDEGCGKMKKPGPATSPGSAPH